MSTQVLHEINEAARQDARERGVVLCGECKFWVRGGVAYGSCRRRPPTPESTTTTNANDFCGEGQHWVGRVYATPPEKRRA